MFDIRHKNASYSIQELFQDFSEIHSYNTRSPSFSNLYKKKRQDTCTWTLPGETLTYNFNVLWFNFLQSKILQLQGLG